ncbi:MAG: hypothetical protein WC284_10900, partial [Candidimonas sp.]
PVVGETNFGINMGAAAINKAEVYAGKNAAALQFKRLRAGNNVVLTQTADTITIDADGTFGENNTASNVGGGFGLFAQKVGIDLQFNTLVAGDGVCLVQNGNTIEIKADVIPVNALNRGTVGAEVFALQVGNEVQFRRLKAGDNVILTQTTNDICISAEPTGAFNEGRSKGDDSDGGFEVYAGMDGDLLTFKRLFAGNGIQITDNGCGLMISTTGSSGSGGLDGLINIGSGKGIYKGVNSGIAELKSILGSGGISVLETTEEIIITGSDQTLEGENLSCNTDGVGIYKDKLGGKLRFKSLKAGPGVSLTEEDCECIVISAEGSVVIGTPSDGSFDNPRLPGCSLPFFNWTSDTLVADALDDINELLGVMLPAQPSNLSSFTLEMANSVLTAIPSGLTNHTDIDYPDVGTMIPRITSLPAETLIVGPFGHGNQGTLTAYVNGVEMGQIDLDITDNTGQDEYLSILSDISLPSDNPCIWQSITAKISGSVQSGLNSYQLIHSITGETNTVLFWFDETSSGDAEVTNVEIDVLTETIRWSSSVPHFSCGTILTVSGDVEGVVGSTHVPSNIVQIDTDQQVGILVSLDPGDYGIPSSPIPPFTNPISFTDAPYEINIDSHTTSNFRIRGQSTAGFGDWATPATSGIQWIGPELINVMCGDTVDPFGPIIEQSILVNNLGTQVSGGPINAKRIIMSSGDTPADNIDSLLDGNWDSSASLDMHDAAVVGGILRADQTDYSDGYAPFLGPDLSGRDPCQYISFLMRRTAVSAFWINVIGTYSGCWVKVPTLSTPLPNATNGWWDSFKLFGGTGVPGDVSNDDGCAFGTAMTGGSGSFRMTLGFENTSFTATNTIIVRFRLCPGDEITGLSFSGSSAGMPLGTVFGSDVGGSGSNP